MRSKTNRVVGLAFRVGGASTNDKFTMGGKTLLSVPSGRGQMFLSGFNPLEEAVVRLAESNRQERGAVFTRREVVEFMLDLIGYTEDVPLYNQRILEPAAGEGEFLVCIVERLLRAYSRHPSTNRDVVNDLQDCIYAVELHRGTYWKTRTKLIDLLVEAGLSEEQGAALLDAWLVQGDFLLTELPHRFSHVIGNPPYVRQELIPDVLLAEYRSRFQTIYDRADLYVPFFEKSLKYLERGGALGFICADRWMKNRYGGPLRRLVADRFHLKFYVDMTDTPAFHSDVIAYPAITVITNERPGPTRIAHRPAIENRVLSGLAESLQAANVAPDRGVLEAPNVTKGSEPWLLGSFDQLAVVRRLEATFPTLEEAGCQVGIGVATGADSVFIGPYDALDVEPDRKVPLIMTRDIMSGSISWRGYGVINPFKNDAGVVDLKDYPKLTAYFMQHEDAIRRRHVAKNHPNTWYRTIDRIYPDLAERPKLLIPDIKGAANIVLDQGQFYPHHNLYYVTSNEWDLRALRVVLLSGIATVFVSAYSTKMRGGYLRFQAQYLRRIRIPRWRDVHDGLKAELLSVADTSDTQARNAIVCRLFGLSKQEQLAIGGIEE